MADNAAYDDDGKENIIDDCCVLMASTELWIATDRSGWTMDGRGRMRAGTADA